MGLAAVTFDDRDLAEISARTCSGERLSFAAITTLLLSGARKRRLVGCDRRDLARSEAQVRRKSAAC